MNKILIVGHPQSGYQEVETLLNVCGMSKALPSRREGFTPEEIGATLCKAHKVQPLQKISMGHSIDQLEAGPVWHGMALDLMLGNVDQELWGWADPSAVYLLDYWKSLDQNITFILVYNAPETLLAGSAQNELLSEEELQQRVHSWQAYNTALLHFYCRNRERCLLVHARQVSDSANNYLQQVRARISAPLAEPQELPAPADDTAANSSNAIANKAGTDLQTEDEQSRLTALRSDEAALEQYLALALIGHQPQVLQLYAELQSTANLPLAEVATPAIHALQAWRGFSAMRALNRQIDANENIKQESELLLLLLHQAQEELERYYLENQRFKQSGTKPAKKQTTATHYGAAKRVQSQLSYRLGTIMMRNYRTLPGVIRMPWALLYETHQFRRARAATKKLPPLRQYRDAHEGEKVKQHLTYRLGATLIAHSKSPVGWIKLPFALRNEVKAFKQQRRAN